MKLTGFNKISNIKPKNIYSFIKTIFWRGAIHPFEVSIAFIIISIVVGVIVYSEYKGQPQYDNISPTQQPIQIKKYSQLIKLLEERELKFKEASDQIYVDPFRLKVKEESKEESRSEK